MLIILNYAFNFGLNRSEIMFMIFTTFIIKRLENMIYNNSIYCLVIE